MKPDAFLSLVYSKKDIPYYSLIFEDYELPLFGEHFESDNKELPTRGDVCSKCIKTGGWLKVGNFNTIKNEIKIFIYQIGYFIAKPKLDKEPFDVYLLSKPTDGLKLLAYNKVIQIKIPKNSELYNFILRAN